MRYILTILSALARAAAGAAAVSAIAFFAALYWWARLKVLYLVGRMLT